MIDWFFVVRHALWILGAAIVLAAWSFGRLEPSNRGVRTAAHAGAFLSCAGFALTTPLWQAPIWSVLAIYVAWHRQKR